ncbi:MAG: transcription factor [Nitrososphaeria archaeon]|nr:transcription factor [Nitrososphaeria archaeon]
MSVQDDQFIKVAPLFGGEVAIEVIGALLKLGEATDDVIAAESGVKLNDVRKVLYKLYDHALVSSSRTRDPQSGWYIFYWRLETDQLDAFITSSKMRVIEKLKQRLEYERSHTFFECKSCPSQRFTFEDAMETAFMCSSCGGPLESVDNTSIVSFLEKRVESLEKELRGEGGTLKR